jgi:hypothetical protein
MYAYIKIFVRKYTFTYIHTCCLAIKATTSGAREGSTRTGTSTGLGISTSIFGISVGNSVGVKGYGLGGKLRLKGYMRGGG